MGARNAFTAPTSWATSPWTNIEISEYDQNGSCSLTTNTETWTYVITGTCPADASWMGG